MCDIIEVTDLDAPELDVYARLTQAQLRSRREPEKGIFIAESPKVIGHALDAGCVPLSLLMERRQLEGQGRDLVERCGQVPVYTGDRAVLAGLTGYELTRGILCAMRRPRLPFVEELCARASRVAVLEGIVRTFSNAVYDQLRGYILADLRAVEEAFGVRCTFRSNVYYPCVENDPEETRRVTGILGERFVPQKPRMIAEDFSYYQLERPGVFVFCGCMDEARQSPLHSCTFDFDERAILYGLELFSRLIAFES